MSEAMERAHETIEHHAHEHGPPKVDPWARGIAVLISALAAALAITEIGAKSSQNEYLTHHVAVSDDWAYYQAKNLRAVVKETEVQVLSSLPNSQSPEVAGRIKDANDSVARIRDDPKTGDGMKQLAQKAHELEAERNAAYHRYHFYEYAAGALEIAIVLASVSVVTRMRPLGIAAAGIGTIAGLAACCVALGVI